MTDPAVLIGLATICAIIGLTVGATGYGGFLIPVAIVSLAGFSAPDAVFHALLGSVPPTILAGALYARSRKQPMRWPIVGWLSLGTVPGVVLGRWIVAHAPATVLIVVLGLIVIAAGVLMLLPRRQDDQETPAAARHPAVIAGVSVGAGLAAGLTTVLAGVGGPLVTVPVLLALGLPVTAAVGAALLNSLVGIALTLVSLAGQVSIDAGLLSVIAIAMSVGAVVGAVVHHRVPDHWLVRPIAVVALISGGWIAISALS